MGKYPAAKESALIQLGSLSACYPKWQRNGFQMHKHTLIRRSEPQITRCTELAVAPEHSDELRARMSLAHAEFFVDATHLVLDRALRQLKRSRYLSV